MAHEFVARGHGPYEERWCWVCRRPWLEVADAPCVGEQTKEASAMVVNDHDWQWVSVDHYSGSSMASGYLPPRVAAFIAAMVQVVVDGNEDNELAALAVRMAEAEPAPTEGSPLARAIRVRLRGVLYPSSVDGRPRVFQGHHIDAIMEGLAPLLNVAWGMTAVPAPDMVQDVIDWHAKFRPAHTLPVPSIPPAFMVSLVRGMLGEEYHEELAPALAKLHELALAAEDGQIIDRDEALSVMAEVADHACDTIYFIIGACLAAGIDLRPAWREVQRTNMAKVGGPTRADGKILKPEGWQAPDLLRVLSEQLPLRSGDSIAQATDVQVQVD